MLESFEVIDWVDIAVHMTGDSALVKLVNIAADTRQKVSNRGGQAETADTVAYVSP